jgi:uncharacterized protein (DUF4415 family)
MSEAFDEYAEVDFSRGRRGAVLPSPGKRRITIRIDGEILDWFRDQAEAAGGGGYQSMINLALREYIAGQHDLLEATLRRVIREEMAQYRVGTAEESSDTVTT